MPATIQIHIASLRNFPTDFPLELSPTDICRLRRISNPTRCRAFLASRLLLERFLPGCLPLLDADPNGKPYFSMPELPAFNITHSGSRVAVALAPASDEAGVTVSAIGVDIEYEYPRPGLVRNAEGFLHPDEAGWLQSLPETEMQAAFYRLWSIKEAVGKVDGRGMTGFSEFSVLSDRSGGLPAGYGEPVVFRHWQLPHGWHLAIAWRGLLRCNIVLGISPLQRNRYKLLNIKNFKQSSGQVILAS